MIVIEKKMLTSYSTANLATTTNQAYAKKEEKSRQEMIEYAE